MISPIPCIITLPPHVLLSPLLGTQSGSEELKPIITPPTRYNYYECSREYPQLHILLMSSYRTPN